MFIQDAKICPGGAVEVCVGVCPGTTARIYGACVQVCSGLLFLPSLLDIAGLC